MSSKPAQNQLKTSTFFGQIFKNLRNLRQYYLFIYLFHFGDISPKEKKR